MSAFDPFQSYDFGPNSPGIGAYEITPSDAANLPLAVRAIRIGGVGNVRITDRRGVVSTWAGMQVGERIDVCTYRVHATGTTATNLVGIV